MSRENRNLIINAGVFVLIAVLFIFGMTRYNTSKKLSSYKGYFPEATNFKIESLDDEIITEVVNIYKGKDVIGYLYTGIDYAENIPTHEQWSLLKLQVVVSKEGKIIDVIVLEHEHTPNFFAKVEQYLPTLKGVMLVDYKAVDEVGGASQFSMPSVKKILDKVTVLVTNKEPNPAPQKDPYLLLFGEYDEVVKDETFTATENVLKKEEVKDASGNSLGFAYTVFGVTEEFLHEEYKKEYGELTLLVALDADNKVIGIRTLISTHTGNYYDKYEAEYEKLVGKVLEGTVNVDLITGSTVSGNSITKLIEALKGVLE